MVEAHLGKILGDSIQKAFQSYTAEFEKKAQAEKKRYINLIERSVKDIINNEVKTQLPQILPKEVSNFVTHAALKHDWFKKPERPLTPDSDWNARNQIRVELEYNIEECYKAVTDRLDWNNPEGKENMFDLRKPLSLIMDRVTKLKAMKWYDYGYLEEIEVQREDQQFCKFKEGDFPRLHLRIVILKRVEDLQLGVKSYQKKLNITKPETFRFDISNRTSYTTYNNPQGIIYQDKYKRNRLICLDELYKFNDGTLTSVRFVLGDIALNLRLDYLPKRR
nr:hypothetical protein [Tanacetum cinerariifolium]